MRGQSQGNPYPGTASTSGPKFVGVSSSQKTTTTPPHASLSRPYRRKGGTAGLFVIPLRQEIPDGTYAAAPQCWWSRATWIAHAAAQYEAHYPTLRAARLVPSVSKKTFLDVMTDMSAGADEKNGRDCRTPVGYVRRNGRRTGMVRSTGKCRRTVQRARALARALSILTEVIPGRLRTLAERIESWRRGDRSRGWCSVSVLHESTNPALPVDNSRVQDLLEQENVTPLLRRRGKHFFLPRELLTTAKNMKKGGAAHRKDNGTRSKKGKRAAAFEPRALLLASKCIQHPDMPSWVKNHGAKSWASVLTKAARAGWDADDVVEAIRDYSLAHSILHRPENPWGYLARIITSSDLECPPARALKAHEAAMDKRRIDQQQALRAEWDRRDAHAAGPDSPARRAAVAAIAQQLKSRTRR